MQGRIWSLWPAMMAGLALAVMALYAVPGRAELAALPSVSPAPSVPAAEKLININTASLEELMTLPDIGETRAKAIAEYRESEGPFRYPEELIYVPGIGEGMLEGLLPLITTGGG